MSTRPALATALALLLSACGEQPTEPGSLDAARGGNPGSNATPLTASPTSLALLIPSTTTGTVTARVQFVGVITSSTSDAACATVSPLSLPATKPAGSSVYVATFTITAVEQGNCTITLTDKRGGTATVQVQVRELPPVDGTRLLYSFSDGVEAEVRSSNPDLSDAVAVLTGGGQASYTPDRSQIVYVSNEAGSLNLFRVNADGTGKEQMTFYEIGTHVGAGTQMPTVSPDGQKIAFVLSTGLFTEPTQIYVMDAVPGATPVAITAGNARHWDPSYAPDGSIVFSWASLEIEETDDGVLNYSIWSMAGNGANLTRLTNPGLEIHRGPTVSPDGTTIAFGSRSQTGERSVITLIDSDGQNQRAITSVGSDVDPVFSPDGTWIAFTRIVDPETVGNAEIFVLKLGRPESETVNVTDSEVDETLSDWR